MKIKNRIFIFLAMFFLVFTVLNNYIQKTVPANSHAHHENNLLSHSHVHSHAKVVHSHAHSAINITILDHLVFDNISNNIDKTIKTNADFEDINFLANDYINKLFKPPKITL